MVSGALQFMVVLSNLWWCSPIYGGALQEGTTLSSPPLPSPLPLIGLDNETLAGERY